ncbi:MAG: hypothetical protein DIJKHBIC_04314 [Thermoanaerobaculia bacterium]|nr:hypothetical protein [Thermoanaerobaculia bacterium]
MRNSREQLLEVLRNPFDENRVDSAWAAGLLDIAEINRTVFERILRAIERVRETRISSGLLVYGERGSGKTHILHRLRTHVLSQPAGLFAFIRPSSAPDRMVRHLLAQLAYDLQQRDEAGLTQLEASAAGLLFEKKRQRKPAARAEIASFWASLTGEVSPGAALFSYLSESFEEIAFELGLDANVVRAIEHLLARHHRTPAFQWLSARSVPEDGLAGLGIPANIETEEEALGVIRALLSLSPGSSVDVLAFDQLEGLLPRREVRDQLEVYGGMVATLISSIPSLLVISCSQVSFVPDLQASVRKADFDRLAHDQAALQLIRDRNEIALLLKERMRRHDDLQTARFYLEITDPLWPLNERSVREMVHLGGRAIRDIIDAARLQFEVQCGREEHRPEPRTLSDVWEDVLEDQTHSSSPSPERGVLSDALVKALMVTPSLSERSARILERSDLDVETTSGGRTTRVGFLTEQNLTSLAARLKRIHKSYPDTSRGALVLARDERLPLKKTARVVREELSALQKAGHSFTWIDSAARSALLAAKRLLDSAASGDLSDGEKPIEVEDLKKWLAAGCPEALESALSTLLPEGETTGPRPDFEPLLELLEGRFLLDLETVTRETGIAKADLERLLADPSAPAALIGGVPGVVFLRPSSVTEA